MKRLLVILISFLIIACNQVEEDSSEHTATFKENPNALNIPDGFDYKMDRDITFKIQVLDHNGLPSRHIGIQVYEFSGQEVVDEHLSAPTIPSAAILIFSGQTDEFGYLEESIRIPMHLTSVQIQASQLGINNRVTMNTNTDVIFHEFK